MELHHHADGAELTNEIDYFRARPYYVPKAAQDEIRAGVAAWQALQDRLRDLAELTKEQVLQRAKEGRER